jgi:SAM-dependent methyltransferase
MPANLLPESFAASPATSAPISRYVQGRKIRFFLEPIPLDAAVLEVGCGSGWVGNFFRHRGQRRYVGMDLFPPADVVGDIKQWRELGLMAESFDYIIAFEVVEHVDLCRECFDLLKPGGRLLVTSPVPSRDWVLKILEALHLCQKRTSPHSNLIDLRDLGPFETTFYRQQAGLSQWGVLQKPATAATSPSATVTIDPSVRGIGATRRRISEATV